MPVRQWQVFLLAACLLGICNHLYILKKSKQVILTAPLSTTCLKLWNHQTTTKIVCSETTPLKGGLAMVEIQLQGCRSPLRVPSANYYSPIEYFLCQLVFRCFPTFWTQLMGEKRNMDLREWWNIRLNFQVILGWKHLSGEVGSFNCGIIHPKGWRQTLVYSHGCSSYAWSLYPTREVLFIDNWPCIIIHI